MKNLDSLFISQEATIKEALEKLNYTGNRILLVVENRKLLGTLNDGDIRRWILANENLLMPVFGAMNKNPIFLYAEDKCKAKQVMEDNFIEAVPIVDHEKYILDIIFLNKRWNQNKIYQQLNVPVVIMAGGEGKRLYPYTKVLPKPLIPVNESTILENIIDRFRLYGCNCFYLTLNYKKNLIKAYFSDISLGYDLHYIEEKQYLGTCGSLKLLSNQLNGTFFVTNCDILIDDNYYSILNYHKQSGNLITVVAVGKDFKIPYGVILQDENNQLQRIDEKPEFHYLISSGVYIMEPKVLDYIPSGYQYDMPALIDRCKGLNEKIGIYTIPHESWMDMGELGELGHMLKRMEER